MASYNTLVCDRCKAQFPWRRTMNEKLIAHFGHEAVESFGWNEWMLAEEGDECERIMSVLPLRPSPPCRYGVRDLCGRPATTKRQRPNGSEIWDVCDFHAASLDRLRSNIECHSALLARLAKS